MEINASLPDYLSLEEIDLFDAERYATADRHGVWRTLRDKAPVWQQATPDGSDFWSLTTYPDCDRILRDHQTFSSEDGTILASVGVGDTAGGQTITLMDPPAHTQIRRPAMRLLGGSGVRARMDLVTQRVRELAAPLADGGSLDFAALVELLPMTMFGDLMGVPRELWAPIARAAGASIAPEDPTYSAGQPVEQTMIDAHYQLFALFSDALAYRRQHPGDDLLTILDHLEIGEQRLDDRQIMLNCYSYVLGAHSTTPHVAAHTLRVLAERPELWAQVTADRNLLPALIDEGARWTSPTHHLVRRATTDVEVHGERIAAGDWVCAWVASANRDEQVFSNPYQFQLNRTPNPHLSFGAGAHFCIGTHLSRAALSILFGFIVDSLDRVEVGEPTHLRSNWINGLSRQPIVAYRR